MNSSTAAISTWLYDEIMESRRYRQLVSRLKLRHLRLVEAVAEAGGVSAAAEVLKITQPAVSKGLREVEEIIGMPLFERGPQGLSLTATGQIVLARGKVIQSELRQVSDEIEALSTGISGIMSIGTALVSRPKLIPRALNLMRARTSAAAVRLIDGTEETLLDWLREGTLDLMVGRLPPTDRDDEFVREVLCNVPIVVVAGKHHPLAARADVSYLDLAKVDWIFPPPRSFVHAAIMQVFVQNGLPRPKQYVECLSYLTVRSLLTENAMVAALPQSVTERDEETGAIVRLPVALPHVSLPVGIIMRADRSITPSLKLLVECLRMAAY